MVISTTSLVGSAAALRIALDAKCPPMRLIEARPQRYHYAVAIGVDADRVLDAAPYAVAGHDTCNRRPVALYAPVASGITTRPLLHSPEFGRHVADIDSAADDSRPTRKGLPPSYRMRADRHYVDLIASHDHVPSATPWSERAFDPEWHDRPGGGDSSAILTPRGSRVGLTITAGA